MRIRTGDTVVGRYTLFEQVDDHWGVCGWRAHDEVLDRDVLLTTFARNDPRAGDLVSASRATAVLSDHRLVRVLDANLTDETGYIVREWVAGQTLADLLARGPLEDRVALRITQDVAEVVAHAHRKGIAHLCLDPLTVIIEKRGDVRVRGFGTAAVLRSVTPSARGSMADDVNGIGRVLYSCLTARYPGDNGHGIPPVITIDGRIPRPRQVRARVPRNLDRMTARALPCGRQDQVTPYTSALDVARDAERLLHTDLTPGRARVPVSTVPNRERHLQPLENPAPLRVASNLDVAHQHAGAPPPALDPVKPRRRAGDRVDERREPIIGLGQPAEPSPPDPQDSSVGRVAMAAVATALLIGALMLTVQAVRDASETAPEVVPPAPVGQQEAPRQIITPATAYDFDPLGDGEEGSEFAFHAIDGDPQTAWVTSVYYDPLEVQKDGVGLVVDLGVVTQVDRIRLQLVREPTEVQVGLADASSPTAPDTLDDFRMIGQSRTAGERITIRIPSPQPTRYVLVWLTALPPSPGGWQGGIEEVEILG